MGHRKASKLLVGTPLLLALTLGTACAVGSKREHISIPPPLPRSEVKFNSPGPAYAWVGGHWVWRGTEYDWVDGRWEPPPRSGSNWVPGRWRETRHGWRWVEGHWR